MVLVKPCERLFHPKWVAAHRVRTAALCHLTIRDIHSLAPVDWSSGTCDVTEFYKRRCSCSYKQKVLA